MGTDFRSLSQRHTLFRTLKNHQEVGKDNIVVLNLRFSGFYSVLDDQGRCVHVIQVYIFHICFACTCTYMKVLLVLTAMGKIFKAVNIY